MVTPGPSGRGIGVIGHRRVSGGVSVLGTSSSGEATTGCIRSYRSTSRTARACAKCARCQGGRRPQMTILYDPRALDQRDVDANRPVVQQASHAPVLGASSVGGGIGLRTIGTNFVVVRPWVVRREFDSHVLHENAFPKQTEFPQVNNLKNTSRSPEMGTTCW